MNRHPVSQCKGDKYQNSTATIVLCKKQTGVVILSLFLNDDCSDEVNVYHIYSCSKQSIGKRYFLCLLIWIAWTRTSGKDWISDVGHQRDVDLKMLRH
jgi:hypothetical protein